MTNISVSKNVDTSLSINIPDAFYEMYPIGSIDIRPVARMGINLNLDASQPATSIHPTASIASVLSFDAGESTQDYTPAATITREATTANCILYEGGSFSIVTSATGYMGMGSYIADGRGDKAWLPFDNITYNSGQQIISAFLKLTASETRSRDYVNVKMGCENFSYTASVDVLDSPPTDYNNLNRRIMTQAVNYFSSVQHWTLNTTYTFDITTSVQEILNKSTWTNGHALAVMIFNNASDGNQDREFWGAANANANYRPTLVINV